MQCGGVLYHKWLPLRSSLLALFSVVFWPESLVQRAKEKHMCKAAVAVRLSVHFSWISISFLPFGFKVLNSLEMLGCVLLR